MRGSNPRLAAVKVLFIVGAGRSGSTILGNVLGEAPGIVHAGELNDLWSLLGKGRYCGCERLLGECGFWQSVLADVLGTDDHTGLRPAEIDRWYRETVRYRRLARLLVRPSDSDRRYAGVMADLYAALATSTGANVVVDTSKGAPGAALLRLMPDIEPHFVHLVRDPRGVAYSWQRTKNPPRGASRVEMGRWPPGRVARNWLAVQSMIEISRSWVGDRWMTVRYEDLAARPKAVVGEILHFVGEDSGSLPFVDEATVLLGNNHTVGGNRNRFKRGEVRFRVDDDWMTHQSRRNRRLITLMTSPLLWRYGYPSRSRRPGVQSHRR